MTKIITIILEVVLAILAAVWLYRFVTQKGRSQDSLWWTFAFAFLMAAIMVVSKL